MTRHCREAQFLQVHLKKSIVSHPTEQSAFLKMHQSNQASTAIETAARQRLDHRGETLHLFCLLLLFPGSWHLRLCTCFDTHTLELLDFCMSLGEYEKYNFPVSRLNKLNQFGGWGVNLHCGERFNAFSKQRASSKC